MSMKKLFYLLVLCFSTTKVLGQIGTVKSFEQTTQKSDTVYYLLDTTGTPHNEQMWRLEYDPPMMYAAILCPCVDDKDMPAFSYRTDVKVKQVWESAELARHKLLSLP